MTNRVFILSGLVILNFGAPLWSKNQGIPIEVQVEISEIDHSQANQYGVDWLDKIQLNEQNSKNIWTLGQVDRATRLMADIRFLSSNGAAELLANPNLVTESGTTASFQAGGQIPYATSSSIGTTNVEFKSYGVLLKVKPTLLDSGEIEMKLKASVSAPDGSTGVVISGVSVPGLLTREIQTELLVRPGVTVTLAGLVQSFKETFVQGIPILKKIPILGYLFRWEKTEIRKTTVIMFLTPRLLEN